MRIPKFNYFGLDPKTINNFELLEKWFNNTDLLKFEWKFFKFEVPSAVTNYQIPHNCGFIPTDLLKTAETGTITFHYDNFTDKFIYITTTGAAKFRGMLGKYRENIT